MFSGLLKSKFYSKCKSAIKLTKTRIEMIKRKRNATQKYLRNDIADLLKNGLDINAYGRAEGLLVELNMSACYDFIDQFCGCVLNHLPEMNKQRECPEECREAVPSLLFAAARFADLPELRELRSIFSDRFGNSLEACVNQEFVEKLKATPPTKDMKLQLLQDIALESGLQWDSKALSQKLFNPPSPERAWSKNTDADNLDTKNNKQPTVKDATPKMHEEDPPSYGRKEVSDDRYKPRRYEGNAGLGGDLENTSGKDTQVASIDQNDQQKNSNLERRVSEEKADDDKKPFYYRFIPPPYTKPKAGETETSSCSEGIEAQQADPITKPKPRSVRRRRLEPPGHDNVVGNNDEGDGAEKLNSNGTRQKATKPGLKIAIGDDLEKKEDEEERKMDQLLKHYSTKQSPYEEDEVKSALKPRPSQQSTLEANNTSKNRTKDGPPARAVSLPVEQTSPTETTSEGHVRVSSFQPDTGHVHPKLPDYDDFVARLSALRGK